MSFSDERHALEFAFRAYNRRGEVTNAVVSGVSDAYAWDSIGNPTGVDVNCLNQIHRPAQYDPLSVYYTPYTQNGELAADWDVRYLYDAESRLVAVGTWLYDEERYLSGDYDDWMDLWTFDVAVSNRYDHLGRRVQKITPEATHTYFYDGWLLIKERPSNPSRYRGFRRRSI